MSGETIATPPSDGGGAGTDGAAPRRRLRTVLAVALPLALLGGAAAVVVPHLAGSSDAAATAPHVTTTPASHAPSPTPTVPPRPPVVVVSPRTGTHAVRLDQPVVVRQDVGAIRTVSVTGAGALPLTGALSADRRTWVSTAPLAAGTRYTVRVVSSSAAGAGATSADFVTLTPQSRVHASLNVGDGMVVGVAMPLVVDFDAPVTDKAAVQRHLSVEASTPVTGAWHWFGDQEVRYRPRAYWPTGERITLTASLAGVDTGGGRWGEGRHSAAFRVGDSHVSLVDAATHTMTVRVNGTVVRTVPVSTGRGQYPTINGIHVVAWKTASMIMDSATVGIPKGNPDYYYETVAWDVNISRSGEFVHSAPWSVYAQGSENVSHGCVNASPENARWFYELSQPGDVVQVVGSPRPPDEVSGTYDWNASWADWVAGSALPVGTHGAA